MAREPVQELGWRRVEPQQAASGSTTLLVVGAVGVRGNPASDCQVAAYRVPIRGAVVVVVAGW